MQRATTTLDGASVCFPPAALRVRPWPDLAAPSILERQAEAWSGSGAATLGDIIAAAEAVALRGRGGAGFPFATKLRAVADAAAVAGTAHVVANGEEGEPASAKDRYLLTTRPHLVLDGLLLVADALHAKRAVVYVSDAAVADVVSTALAQRPQPRPVEVFLAPRGYVSGEETAVANALSGGLAKPTRKPPRPYQRGVDGAPTLVSNVETLAHLARAVRLGADVIRHDGTDAEPGTTLVTVTPDRGPSVLTEAPFGVPIAEVLRHAGHPEPRAMLTGGFFGGFLPRAQWQLPLGHATMRAAGAVLGCAALLPIVASCPVRAAADVLAYFDRENAQQCGACFNGIRAMAAALARLTTAAATERDAADLHRWSTSLPGRGNCATLDGAAAVVRSLLREYEPLVTQHISATCTECAGDRHDLSSTRFALSVPTRFEERA